MVKQLTLADLITGMGGTGRIEAEIPVYAVVDSRKVKRGSVFFALPGEHTDGHQYVADAFARGAVAAVVSRDTPVENIPCLDLTTDAPAITATPPIVIRVRNVLRALQDAARHWRQQFTPRVIGITGSVGKTTTKEVVARVLAQRYHVLRNDGSQNNEIGLPLTLLRLTGEHERVVLEMGMYVRGDITFLADMAHPHVGVITNVASVHASRTGSLTNITLAKQELVEALPPAPEGVAILNYDDPRVRPMAQHTQARPFFYGFSPRADLWADEIQGLGLDGIRLRLHYQKERLYVKVPLLGQHSVHTVLRATAVGLVEGLTWQEIIEGLRSPATQLRLVTVPGPHGSLILDDTYNASPPSTLAALNLLRDLDGRKLAVLGDMLELGDYEEAGHLKVGCRSASVVAELITVGPLARDIARGAELCGMDRRHIHTVNDSKAALPILCQLLQPGDVVLVKGSRAMKMERIVEALAVDETSGREEAMCDSH